MSKQTRHMTVSTRDEDYTVTVTVASTHLDIAGALPTTEAVRAAQRALSPLFIRANLYLGPVSHAGGDLHRAWIYGSDGFRDEAAVRERIHIAAEDIGAALA